LNNIDFAFIPIFFAVFLFSLSFHEAAHAWTAERFGDSTGRYLGRITLNPIPHIDVFGTILFPLIGMLSGGMMFGWAKPVPVNTLQMRDRKLGDICVSLAGPLSNALLAVVFFVLLKTLFYSSLVSPLALGEFAYPAKRLLSTGLFLNVLLMVFNLLPIPPLDGSHVLRNLLPDSAAEVYERLQPYGFLLMILLLVTGTFGTIYSPISNFVAGLLYL
jgi:Zn-dependent protease